MEDKGSRFARSTADRLLFEEGVLDDNERRRILNERGCTVPRCETDPGRIERAIANRWRLEEGKFDE